MLPSCRLFLSSALAGLSRWNRMGPNISLKHTSGTKSITENPHALNSYNLGPFQVPIPLMDSESHSQVGCLGNFFWSTLHKFKPPRPKSSPQPCNSQATSIAKDRSEVVASEGQVDSDNQKEGLLYHDCDYSCSLPNEWWTSARPPSYSAKEPFSAPDNEAAATVERTLDKLNPELRDLSLKIHGIFLRRPRLPTRRIIHSNFRSPGIPVPGKVHNAISHQCTRAVWLKLIPQVCS